MQGSVCRRYAHTPSTSSSSGWGTGLYMASGAAPCGEPSDDPTLGCCKLEVHEHLRRHPVRSARQPQRPLQGVRNRLRQHHGSLLRRPGDVGSKLSSITDISHAKGKGLLWPTTLILPARPPRLIYLDLNHWIELSKAHSGHKDGERHRDILRACLEAVSDNRAVFPLSQHIYAEIAKITSYRQRHDLREVIEQVCQYKVVTALSVVATHEIETVLNQVVGPSPVPLNTTDYLDWGVDRAFGRVGDIRIRSASGEDVTEEFRRNYPQGPTAFDGIILDAQLELNRKAVEGPTPQEEPLLRKQGWKPEVIVQASERSASAEREQAQRLDDDPNWRLGRIRDLITAREAIVEVGDIFAEGFARRGFGAVDQFFAANPDDLRAVYSGMPSFNVAVTLKMSLHRDSNHRWTNNDIFDIRALALTIPYCDVVLTDRSMWSHVTRHKLPERYDTAVISRLTDLPNHML